MELGIGMMHLPARDFWAMTMPEFLAALDGWKEMQGLGGGGGPGDAPVRAELAAMMRRFPD